MNDQLTIPPMNLKDRHIFQSTWIEFRVTLTVDEKLGHYKKWTTKNLDAALKRMADNPGSNLKTRIVTRTPWTPVAMDVLDSIADDQWERVSTHYRELFDDEDKS